MKQRKYRHYLSRALLTLFTPLGLLSALPPAAHAATSLTVTPITWDVIGLDSKNVNVGPGDFPVGARICNTGSGATSVTGINFVWDDGKGLHTGDAGADSFINLRDGIKSTLYSAASPLSLAAGACSEAYFQVAVNRLSTAYNHGRAYHITAADAGGEASTPTTQQLYVEHLIAQPRNSVTGLSMSTDGAVFTPVRNGGTMAMVAGKTYWVRLDTATPVSGCSQLESFVNFPNPVFQVLSTSTTYSTDTSLPSDGGRVPNPNGSIYADACLWNNDPGSPNFRSCSGFDGKAGGTVSTTYKLKVLAAPRAPLANPVRLTPLVYDFSGASYHYNADIFTAIIIVRKR